MPTYYFAYGSNMSAKQMSDRCPGATFVAVGKLQGWRFIINEIGAAALRNDPKAHCFGVLWRCHDRHMADLDRYEGVKQGVYRRQTQPVQMIPLGRKLLATVYIANQKLDGSAPIPGYMEHAILPGAKEFSLPRYYIEQLKTWLPGGNAYADPTIRLKSTYRFGLKKTRKFTGWGGQR